MSCRSASDALCFSTWRWGQKNGQRWYDPLLASVSSKNVGVAHHKQVALLFALVKVGDVARRRLAQEWLGDKPRLATVAHRERLSKLQRSRAVSCVIGACRVPASDT